MPGEHDKDAHMSLQTSLPIAYSTEKTNAGFVGKVEKFQKENYQPFHLVFIGIVDLTMLNPK